MQDAIKSMDYAEKTRPAFAVMAAMTAVDKQSGVIEVSVSPAQHLLHSVIYPFIYLQAGMLLS